MHKRVSFCFGLTICCIFLVKLVKARLSDVFDVFVFEIRDSRDRFLNFIGGKSGRKLEEKQDSKLTRSQEVGKIWQAFEN